jgi:NodT family efflux transporter outer membrane factor (OMF) lipoprotein
LIHEREIGAVNLKRILAAAVCLAFASCANVSGVVPRARRVDPQTMNVGSALQGQGNAVWPDKCWWQAYGDPQLDTLVDEVLNGNPGLRLASARVTRAQGFAAIRSGATLPQVEADAGITRTYLTHEEVSASLAGAHTVWDNSILLNASYDLDLWGARRSALASALDMVHAGEAEERAAQLALTTALVQGYVQLSEQYALRDIARENLERERNIFGIAQRRHNAGLGTRLDVDEAVTVLSDTLAQIQAIEEAIALQAHQIAALAGKGPGDAASITRPMLRLEGPVRVPESLPAELVGHRPDVMAQRWRVESAIKEIKVARAQFYPNINLVAFAGVSGLDIGRLLNGNSLTAGAGPAISLPVFNGGILRGNLRVQTASYDIAVESYNEVVIGALQEVADRVVSLRSLQAQLELTDEALESALRAYKLAERGYRGGLVDYLNVLNAQAELLTEQRARALIAAKQLQAHAGLMKALGGGYAEDRYGTTAMPDTRP